MANTSWGQNSRIDALEFRNMEGDRKVSTMNNVYQNMNWYLENLSSSYFPGNKSNSQQGLLIVKRHNPFLLFCLNGISPQVFSHKKLWTFGSKVAVAFFKLCLHGSGCISLTLGSVSLCFYSQLMQSGPVVTGSLTGSLLSNFFCLNVVTLWMYQTNSCVSYRWRDG